MQKREVRAEVAKDAAVLLSFNRRGGGNKRKGRAISNILITAYGPLRNNTYGIPRVIDDPTVAEIAKKLNKDPAQLLISWAIQRGSAVLPKSVTPSRIESNFEDFIIPDADYEALNKLNRNARYNYPFRWGVDVFAELGAEEAERRAEEHAASQR